MNNTNKVLQKLIALTVFLLLSFLVIFINVYPNYYALSHTEPGFRFSGQASWFDPWDINVYVSAIRSGSTNGLLLSNSYTTTPHHPVLLYSVYTLAGSLFPSLNPFLLFHILAVLSSFIFLIVLFFLIKVFLKDIKIVFIVFFLVSLGGGLGWLFFPKIESADLFMTGFTFTSHFQRGHESLGILFYLSALVFFYLGTTRKNLFFNFLSLGSTFLMILFYPYYLLSYGLICYAYSLKKNYYVYIIFNFLIALSFLAVYYFHLNSSLGFAGVLSQQLNTPNIISLILGYAVLLPFLIIALTKWNKDDQNFFLSSWIVLSLSLSFLPLGFARFFLRTLFLPIIMLIFLNLERITQTIRLSKQVIIVLLIFLVPLSTFYIFYRRLAEVTKKNPWYFISEEEGKALDYLDKHSPKGSGVLSYYTLGNYIPAYSSNRVYFGHYIQTPSSSGKIQNILRFYAQNYSDDDAKSLLKIENISYVIFGNEEKYITKAYTKKTTLKYPFLKPVFNNNEITILSTSRY